MRKSLLTFVLCAVPLFFACSDDNDPDGNGNEENSELGIRSQPSTFDIYGGTVTLNVIADNISDWKVSTDDKWITLGEPDYENDTFTVTVKDAQGTERNTGTVKLTAEGAEPVEITILQAGLNPYLNRSSLQYMNLRGRVKSADSHVKIILRDIMQRMNITEVKNITFNEDGMLTGMTIPYVLGNGVISNATYDSDMRLESLDFYNEFAGLKHEVNFNYSREDIYISTEELYQDFLDMISVAIEPKMWLPYMVKDIESIDVSNYSGFGDEFVMRFYLVDEEPNKKIMKLKLFMDGEVVDESVEDQIIYYIDNGYTNIVDYPSGLGFNVFQRYFYDVDLTTGLLKRYDNTYYMNSDPNNSDIWYYSELTMDRMNTISKVIIQEMDEDDNIFFGECIITYNDYLDPVHIESFNIYGGDLDISYVYDSYGNWTEMTIVTSNSPSGTDGTQTFTRNLTYYE